MNGVILILHNFLCKLHYKNNYNILIAYIFLPFVEHSTTCRKIQYIETKYKIMLNTRPAMISILALESFDKIVYFVVTEITKLILSFFRR